MAVEYLRENFSYISEITDQIKYGEEIFSSAIKGAGICLITNFSSDLCKENGNRLIADVIEFTGRIMLLFIAVPYIETIIKTAFAFIK
ncbi:MAG: stage III sporulation AC/AD family protein [Clostridia bacterium]|nr:stage III sporulation AC/AD family protein [Clostridia bacterium]